MPGKPSYKELEKRVKNLEKKILECKAEKENLQKERNEFIAIFDNLDAGIYVADPETYELLYANKKVRESKPDMTIIGRKCYNVLQNLNKPCGFCTNNKIFGENTGSPYVWEFRNKANNRWYHCVDKAIRWIDGRIVRFEIAFNIQNLKTVQEALHQSESMYSTLVEQANDGVVIVQDETRIFSNRAMTEISGYSHEELVNQPFINIVAPEFKEQVSNHAKLLHEGKKAPMLQEAMIVCKDGTLKNVEVSYSTIQYLGEIAFIAIIRDVTKRKDAETAAKESKQVFRILVENSLTGIFIFQEGKIFYENPEQERIFGFLSPSDILTDFKQKIHPDDLVKAEPFLKMLETGKIHTMDTDIRFSPKGDLDQKINMRWVQCRTSKIEFRGKEAALVNMIDITRAKELESLLNIEDKMTSLGRVAAGMAHEIRSPLSGINLLFDNLKDICNSHESISSDTLDEFKKIIEKMRTASHKIEAVVKRVLDFSRPSEVKKNLTNVNYPVDEAIKLSSVTIKKENISLKQTLADNIPLFQANQQMIEQVVINLITNAIQAMSHIKPKKKIHVSSSFTGGNILITVADSGPGVPLSLLDKIFDPYFSTKSYGSGIGLSLSNRIIKDHGGTLEVSKSRLGGAEFTIKLPVATN